MKVEWLKGVVPFSHVAHVTVDRSGPTRIDMPIGAGASLLTVQGFGVRALRPDAQMARVLVRPEPDISA
ncbi:hypothetical protein [Rhodococcus kronopolitis]|uniref:Ferrous iron transport protein A n=1 Tax=Rhodococcus kronopolitis TaxID=1460226 RepID=A0ABV9FVU7_9NOCA